jgi:hypothetical protein
VPLRESKPILHIAHKISKQLFSDTAQNGYTPGMSSHDWLSQLLPYFRKINKIAIYADPRQHKQIRLMASKG